MSVASRPVATGKTRTCPHCKATILESLSICPGCMHHLRFDSEAAKRQVAATPALRVEGMIRHPPLDQPLEYFVIIAIRNDRGEEVTRQVVNVGALQAAEKRTFTLSVEVLPPQAPPATKSNAPAASVKAPAAQPTAAVRAPLPPPPTQGSKPVTGQSTAAGGQPVAPPAGGAAQPGASGGGTAGPTGQSASTAGAGPAGHSTAASTRTAGSSSPGASGSAGGAPAAGGSSPSSTAKPQSSYPGGLRPPMPGGPKRH